MKSTTKTTKKLNIIKKPTQKTSGDEYPSFRLFHFDILNMTRFELDGASDDTSTNSDDSNREKKRGDDKLFVVQMYGINEKGETASILVDDFEPFFYAKVADDWTTIEMNTFVRDIKQLIGDYYKDSLVRWDLVDSQKLYGFAAGKKSKFIRLTFKNTVALNKAKNLWFVKNEHSGKSLCYYKTKQGKKIYRKECLPALIGTELYEANLLPLLRYFHINSVWPNGWVSITGQRSFNNTTTCKYEYTVSQKQVIAMPEKETVVPYKIMSFDIEAGSSHGDFPLPKKTYKRLAMNMMDSFGNEKATSTEFKAMIMSAFGFQKDAHPNIDLVYPKEIQNKKMIENLADYVLKTPIGELTSKQSDDARRLLTLDAMFDKMKSSNKFVKLDDDVEIEDDDNDDIEEPDEEDIADDSDVEEAKPLPKKVKRVIQITILDVINSDNYDRDDKIRQIDELLTTAFPPLEGDPVTMIGSTLLRYGEKEPYLNHCITLGGCTPIQGAVVEAVPIVNGNKVDAEREVLMRWRDLVLREDPDIIIGYNIFGFDYEFLFRRAEETHCVNEFLQMSRKRGEFCGKRDKFDSSAIEIEQTKIAIASGEYDLRYINMGGRLQVDMYNYFRRNFNLSSYKLDDVASQNISDDVSKVVNGTDFTELHTKNITGLHIGDFIHIELSSFTSDYYMGGKKFTVRDIRESQTGSKILVIDGLHEHNIDKTKKIRWGMAKDDVSPQDIFRMSNGSDDERAIVAKYCIQDCNLVHHLMRKIDVLTEYMEMANLCSVPISFLVFRGQGIKLTSFVAKKCMEKGYLMPDLEKSGSDGGYEGAIVLPPKTKIYIDEPVACVDYSSLYPSSMISQNYCHSSKVWAKEYDLSGKLVREEGEKDKAGNYIYYGLPNYQYVEIEFDTFEWRRNPERPAAKAQKTKVGKRVVCWAQLPNNEKSVMPSILMELLKAREDTKKKAKKASATDPFMANILDKRQLAYKVTANSLYGQCGARTSTFYEKDVAASTTASGRMSITYARRIIEEIYANRPCKTEKHGMVMTNAEYVYGDTDSVFFIFNLTNVETGEKIVGKDALEITIELAQEAAHYSTMFLKPPMNLAYEKTLMPFALLSKKRYVGILYEEDPNKGKLKYMGLSLKRRDSCDYLKDTYGQIINLVMKSGNVMEAIKYLETSLTTLIAGAVPTEKLEITKALRGYYKNPQQIAHWVLANRIGQRDPGNKPKAGDRMRFIHITNPNKKALQGDKIETPEYITQAKLKIDYDFYITNQLLKPICQFMGLALEQIWKNQGKLSAVRKHTDELKQIERECCDFETFIKKKEKFCSEKVKALLFDKYLLQIKNDKSGNQPITNFFGVKK